MNLPDVVSPAEWQAARDRLLVKEKAATRALDALDAERRRLPMVRIEKDYVFTTRLGEAHLIDLFDLTAFGRQEDWEDSPDGWPRTAPHLWWRLHDEATA